MPKKDSAVLEVVAPNPHRRTAAAAKPGLVAEFPGAPIRVYAVRFDPMRAAGLTSVFEENGGVEIVADETGDQVGSGWLDPSIQVVAVGAGLGAATPKLIASIRSARPDLPILIMSPAAGDEIVLNALNLGAKGFLHETSTPQQFEEAVRAVVEGTIWAPRRLQAELIERLLAARDSSTSLSEGSFTGREQQVLNLLLDGRSNREIARNLKIEERTVKSYVTRLMRKMGVKNRTALSVQAIHGKSH